MKKKSKKSLQKKLNTYYFLPPKKKKKKKKNFERNILKNTPLHSSLLVNQLYKFQFEGVQRITYET